MKRSLLLGLFFLLVGTNYSIAQVQINGCGLGTQIEIINGSETPGCTEDLSSSIVEFRALPFYMTYAVVATDEDLNIVAVTRNRKIDFSQLPGGNYRIYGLFYQGLLRAEVGMNANVDRLATQCYGFTDNFVTINAIQPQAGIVTTAQGLSTAFVCSNDPNVSQTVEFATSSTDSPYGYILTDENNVVLEISTDNTIDFSGTNITGGLVYGFSYQGSVLLETGDTLSDASVLSTACYDLSDNAVNIEIVNPMGGSLSFQDGTTSAFTCENSIGSFEVQLEGSENTPYVYIITTRNDLIRDFSLTPIIDFGDLGANRYRIYGAAFTGDLNFAIGDDIQSAVISTACYDLSDNFLSVTIPNLESDNFSLADGSMAATICRDNLSPTTLSFTDSEIGSQNKVYIITDTEQNIVHIDIFPTIDFAPFDQENLQVWCLAYTGSLLTQIGDQINENTIFSSECYDISDQAVEVSQRFISTGAISLSNGNTEQLICLESGLGQSFQFDLSALSAAQTAILITDQDGNILSSRTDNNFIITEDLPTNYRAYAVAYYGNLSAVPGTNIVGSSLADDCFLISDNFVSFSSETVEGGGVQLSDGSTAVSVCAMDGMPDFLTFDALDVDPTANYRFVLTDGADEIILSLSGNSLNFDVTTMGTTRIYGVSYTVKWTGQAGRNIQEFELSDACFDLSDNFIEVTQFVLSGGSISFAGGSTGMEVCKSGLPDIFDFSVQGASSPNYTYYITDEENRILARAESPSFNFDEVDADHVRVWGLAYSGELLEAQLDNTPINELILSDECFELSSNFLTLNKTLPEAGNVSLSDGSTQTSFCFQESNRSVQVNASGASLGNYVYLVSDESGIIQTISESNTIDFSGFSLGNYRIYGFIFNDQLQAQAGDPIESTTLSNDCFALSETFVEVSIDELDGGTVSLSNGETEYFICEFFDEVVFNMQDVVSTGDSYIYLIIDQQTQEILDTTSNSILRLSTINSTDFLVRGLTYSGELLVMIGDTFGEDLIFSSECYDLSDNALPVSIILTDGGTLSFADGSTNLDIACDGTNQLTNIQVSNASDDSYVYILTNGQDEVLALGALNQINFSGLENGSYRIRGASYSGNLNIRVGENVTIANISDGCYDLASNFLVVNKNLAEAGNISSNQGDIVSLCSQQTTQSFDFSFEASDGAESAYLVTTTTGQILAIESNNNFSIEFADNDSVLVYGLAYTGDLTANVGGSTTDDLSDLCFALTENAISIIAIELAGGDLSFTDGSTQLDINCDASNQLIDVVANNASEESYVYFVTNEQGVIVLVSGSNQIDISTLGNGSYTINGVAYTGFLNIGLGDAFRPNDISDDCFALAGNSLFLNKDIAEVGNISTLDGNTTISICATQPVLNASFQIDRSLGDGTAFIVADMNGQILAIENANTFNISLAGTESTMVFGLAYTGNLIASVGGSINDDLSDRCFDLTDTPVTILKAQPEGGSLSLEDGSTSLSICPDDSGELKFAASGNSEDAPFYLLLTSEDNEFIRAFSGTNLNLNGFSDGLYNVWGVVAAGEISINEGDDVTNTAITAECFDLSDSFVSISKMQAMGGQVASIDGEELIYACPGQGSPKIIEFETLNTQSTGEIVYLLTDPQQLILSILDGSQLDLDTLAIGTYQIWSLTYNGELLAMPGQIATQTELSSACFGLSENNVSLIIDNPVGGMITGNGSDGKVCVNNIDTELSLSVTGQSEQTAFTFLVTNDQNQFLFSVDSMLDLDFFFQGDLNVYGLSYTGNLAVQQFDIITETALSDDCFALSENNLTIIKEDIDGGDLSTIQGNTAAFTCPSDGNPDLVEFVNNSISPSANYAYIITTTDNNIFTAFSENQRDFDALGAFSELRVWGVSYTGNLNTPIFADLFEVSLSDGCFDISNNFITIYRDAPEVSEITTAKGSGSINLCPGADDDMLALSNDGTSLAGFAYLLSDEAGILLDIITDAQLNIRSLDIGNYQLSGVSYTGNLTISVGDTLANISSYADNCFELASNQIQLSRGGEVDGGLLSTPSGEDTFYTCPFDDIGELIFVNIPEVIPGTEYRIVITNENNRILFPDIEGGIIPFNGAAPGVYRIWGISFTGEYRGQFDLDVLNDPLSTDCYVTSDNFITVISDTPDGGQVSTSDGMGSITIETDDEIIQLMNNSISSASYYYILTDSTGIIQSVLDGEFLSTDSLANGGYNIYGLSLLGNLNAQVGDNINDDPLADNCFERSSNFISLNINRPNAGIAAKESDPSSEKLEHNIKLELFPNPVISELNVQFLNEHSSAETSIIQIFDFNGKLMYQQQFNANQGWNQENVPVANLQKGIYLLRIQQAGKTQQKKFFKTE